MKEINNLSYALEINYTNDSGVNISISVKLHDTGMEIKAVRLGNICITEETINGRVLSGRFDNLDKYCGYKYDYQNGEVLLNINPNIPINTATALINKTKMEPDFLLAKLVLSSISRNDYRVVILKKGSLNITKTVSAENEKSEHCSLQECVELLKLDGEERFVEQNKKIVYRVGDDCFIEEAQILENSDIKSNLIELSTIINQNPQNYKELIELKSRIRKRIINNSTKEEKTL